MTLSELFEAAAHGDVVAQRYAVSEIAQLPRLEVALVIANVVEQLVAGVWLRGWQPADLLRFADRKRDRCECVLLRWAIAAQSADYEARGERCAPRWMAQLGAFEVTRSWGPSRPYPLQLGASWEDAVRAATSLMRFLELLPVIPTLCDPPPRWRATAAPASPGALPDGLLEKVRALLAKAESTSFDAEAEAFTAKAQELMTRHRVDRALLDAATDRSDGPIGRRIGTEDPYADAKASLLGVVADANGCHAVWSKEFSFATVFGFPDELDSVEELFTSLLVQATGALRREGSKFDGSGRSRTTRFRRSFLVAFAIRIGERLRAAVEETVAAASAEMGTALVPVLAQRADETKAAAEDAFPHVRKFAPSVSDGEGWHAGRRFADVAKLSVERAGALPPR
jgi:uncharacterized protein DUF2786